MAEIIQIDGNTWRIEDGFVRFFLLVGEEKAALIDSGVNCPDASDIAKKLTSKPLILLNTHGDGDHTSGTNGFANIYIHPLDYVGCEVKNRYPNTSMIPLKDTVTLPSVGVFMKNRYNQVKNAKAGETVVLEMGPWHSLSKGFMEEIAKRRDVTFVIHFIYEGKKYEVVIPAGKPLVLDPSIDWYGPLKQNEMFGMEEIQ